MRRLPTRSFTNSRLSGRAGHSRCASFTSTDEAHFHADRVTTLRILRSLKIPNRDARLALQLAEKCIGIRFILIAHCFISISLEAGKHGAQIVEASHGHDKV